MCYSTTTDKIVNTRRRGEHIQGLRNVVIGVRWTVLALALSILAGSASAAPYAAVVMDARTGEVLHSRNADTRLHPASLTKMMTLYVAFQAVENGEIDLDKRVRVSRHAASEPPSKLWLKSGQRISVRHLIRATAVKSANDAATALGEAISGSESAFAQRMTVTARQMGLNNTTFRNAHGLTQSGHLSSARDMTILGRRLFHDFPDYYNLFARRTADAGVTTVRNTNRRLLAAFQGADGIKTGYTRAAGYNLVASARRGGKRVIATVFGGRSSATRDRRVAELLEMGFSRAPRSAAVRPMEPIMAVQPTGEGRYALVRGSGAVSRSVRPEPRPASAAVPVPATATTGELDEIDKAVFLAMEESNPGSELEAAAETASNAPQLRAAGSSDAEAVLTTFWISPAPRPASVEEDYRAAVVVSRVPPVDEKDWGIIVGHYSTRHQAEKRLVATALRDVRSLEGAVRTVDTANIDGQTRYRARFSGLGREQAEKSCVRLRAQNEDCEPVGPEI